MNERVSYWLTAAEPDRTHWSEVIRSLAARFDAPIFEPHVTVYSGALHSNANPEEIVRTATREFSEIVLHASGIGHTEQFTKTLFIEFAANEALTKLSGELKRRSALAEDYELKPHLRSTPQSDCLSSMETARGARRPTLPNEFQVEFSVAEKSEALRSPAAR